jgi:predicted HicB family RNase H-like nuclease
MAKQCTDKNRFELRINEDLKQKAKAKAMAEGKSLSQVVNTAIRQFVNKTQGE